MRKPNKDGWVLIAAVAMIATCVVGFLKVTQHIIAEVTQCRPSIVTLSSKEGQTSTYVGCENEQHTK